MSTVTNEPSNNIDIMKPPDDYSRYGPTGTESQLSPEGRLVSYVLQDYCNGAGVIHMPTIDMIVQHSALPRQTVIEQLEILEKEGYMPDQCECGLTQEDMK